MDLSLFIISSFLSVLQEARFHFPASLGARWDHYLSSSPQDEGGSDYTSSKCGSERPPSLQMQKGCGPKKSHCNWMNVHSHTLHCADGHTHIFIVRSHCDIDTVITVVSRNTEGWGLIIHF